MIVLHYLENNSQIRGIISFLKMPLVLKKGLTVYEVMTMAIETFTR